MSAAVHVCITDQPLSADAAARAVEQIERHVGGDNVACVLIEPIQGGLGESSVVVAASAPHRTEAFAGASELIDRIKAEAPIWKREVGVEGSHWVAGTVPQPPFITGLDGSVAEPRQADRSRG